MDSFVSVLALLACFTVLGVVGCVSAVRIAADDAGEPIALFSSAAWQSHGKAVLASYCAGLVVGGAFALVWLMSVGSAVLLPGHEGPIAGPAPLLVYLGLIGLYVASCVCAFGAGAYLGLRSAARHAAASARVGQAT